MGLFDLDFLNESSNDDIMDTDVDLDSFSENLDVSDDDLDTILEATRYDLEFEKAWKDYQNVWNDHEKSVAKLNKLLGAASSDSQKEKIKNMIEKKDKELKDAYDKLVKKHGNSFIKGSNNSAFNIANLEIDDDPNYYSTRHEAGVDEHKGRGQAIKNKEKMNGLHGSKIEDKIGNRKPGRYNLNESSEFTTDSNATNDVDNGEVDAKISIPAKTELDSNTYNDALARLKQSFKESIDVLSMLENADIVKKTQEEINAEILESVMLEAAYDACVNGPIFEAVDRSDKKAVKEIIKNLGRKFKKYIGEKDFEFFKPTILTKLGQWWSTRLWQTVGILVCEDSYVEKTINTFNETYKDELGDYRFIAVKLDMITASTMFAWDAIRVVLAQKFGYKNHAQAYMILVDKELTAEIEKDVKKLADGIKSSQKSEESKNNDSNE